MSKSTARAVAWPVGQNSVGKDNGTMDERLMSAWIGQGRSSGRGLSILDLSAGSKPNLRRVNVSLAQPRNVIGDSSRRVVCAAGG